MNGTGPPPPHPHLLLHARTAADLMTPDPVSIGADATVEEATVFLTDKGYSAAPVIDEAGRPVGVLSQSDLLVHDRERAAPARPAFYGENDPAGRPDAAPRKEPRPEGTGQVRVRDLMTPVVFSVTPETPVARVVAEMLALQVHRLFVVGGDGALTGVISAFDVLRHLRPAPPAA